MIGYAPPWLFADLTAANVLGFMACGLSLALRSVRTGVVCSHGNGDRETGPLALFLAVGAVANTFWVLGA